MALKLVTACLLGARLNQLVAADENEKQEGPCSSAELQKKETSCLEAMDGAVDLDNVCPAWYIYECCFKDPFASCGSDTQAEISTMLGDRQIYFWGRKQCASANCSSSQADLPAEVEMRLMTEIEFSNPNATRAFTLDKKVEAVKKATGVELPEAVLKGFEIIAKYALPDATPIAKAKVAIANANNVSESQVQVTQSSARRLGVGRRLPVNVDGTITAPDGSKAASVQTSAENTAELESEIGGTVSVAKAPVTLAKVEAKVKSAPSATAQLASQIESAGSDVDGVILV
jgi:hypothetical protein